MKQLLILSGKGGTGKTTVAAAFIRLAKARAFADCDVDAPNLHLLMHDLPEADRTVYYGLPKAKIDTEQCIGCDLCRQHCRFDAIQINKNYEVDPFACEGCGVCEVVCPVGAIELKPAPAGEMMLYGDSQRIFSAAQLKMGSGTSGMLVTEVKKRLISAAPVTDLAVIDGSPGIGCPVIASISGVDLVLIVAEPSLSGISDLDRIVQTAAKFGTNVCVCVNKFDTNKVNAVKIEALCRAGGIAFTGRIPYDPEAVRAINNGLTLVDVDCPAGTAVREVFNGTIRLFDKKRDIQFI
ncbi:MAG: ATP-binding protein [Clostridiaceae bacterium]